MKRLLIFLVLALGMASCSAPKLYQQGLNKIERAIEKDSTLAFPKDTLYLIEYDTIPGIDGTDSIIIQKETIKIPCDFNVSEFKELQAAKTRRELRFERLRNRDSLRHNAKMYKLETDRLEDSLKYAKKANRELTRQLNDANDMAKRLAKEKTKQMKGGWFTRQMGKIWWLLLILGLIAGFVLRSYIPSIPNIFKRNGS